jgi:hypothetical protein
VLDGAGLGEYPSLGIVAGAGSENGAGGTSESAIGRLDVKSSPAVTERSKASSAGCLSGETGA